MLREIYLRFPIKIAIVMEKSLIISKILLQLFVDPSSHEDEDEIILPRQKIAGYWHHRLPGQSAARKNIV